MTVVQPTLQWGVAELAGDGRVEGFVEKPRSEHWINGGFFCFEPGALDYLDEDSVLEREPLERLAADGSCAPTATRASGTAWTPTRTRSSSTTSGPRATRPGAAFADERVDPAPRWVNSLIGDLGGIPVRALVTGAHGFVASHLVAALLARGDEVRVLDRPDPRLADLGGPRRSGLDLLGLRGEVELAEGDLRDAEAVDAAVAGCDSVFHLAAQTIVGVARDSPAETFEVNVRGAWNVFEACRAHGTARVVFASSDKAYGTSPELPTGRISPCVPPIPTTPARPLPTSSRAATRMLMDCRLR